MNFRLKTFSSFVRMMEEEDRIAGIGHNGGPPLEDKPKRKKATPKPKKEVEDPIFREPNADSPLRVSTRVPTTANGRGKSGRGLDVSYDAMKQDPKHIAKVAHLIRGYGVLPKHMTDDTDHNVLEHFINQGADNLHFLHHKVQEQGWAEKAEGWYKGAHHFTKKLAEQYKLPHQSVAAAVAAMSPQKDWHQNANLAERLLSHYHTQQDHEWTPEMEHLATHKVLKPSAKQKGKEDTADLVMIHHAIRGKKLSELSDPDHKAAWIRTYDEAHAGRGVQDHSWTPEMDKIKKLKGVDPAVHNAIRGKNYDDLSEPTHKTAWMNLHYHTPHIGSAYNILSPTGEKTGLAMSKPDSKGHQTFKKVSWGSVGEISKAVQAVESGGDLDKISEILGHRHKIRSFYNNIIHPESSHHDFTSDTHQVAAGLLSPLSGNSVPVAHNFKNSLDKKHRPKNGEWGGWDKGAPGSAKTGIHGTYPLYQEMGRRATERLNQERNKQNLPNQTQSATWEGVRGLFTKEQKSDPKIVDGVSKIWHDYASGKHDADTARRKIYDFAGGIEKPDWVDK